MTSTVSGDVPEVSIERPCLYVVATPIGNMGDITARAAAILRAVDRIFAEDTRVTGRLLQQLAISTPMSSLHEHNERELSEEIVNRAIENNAAIALVSDAGTPLISDPGLNLVLHAHERSMPVRSIPGACAAIAALSIAGIASDRFLFEGFLPAKSSARRAKMSELAKLTCTWIYYEAPHRIDESLDDLREVVGDQRLIAVGRELTKLHETVYRGEIATVKSKMAADSFANKGEFVVVVAGVVPDAAAADDSEAVEMLRVLRQYLSRSDAAKAVSELTGIKRNLIYRMGIDDKP